MLFFVQLSSIVTFRFTQMFDKSFVFFTEWRQIAAFAWYNVKIRIIFGVLI